MSADDCDTCYEFGRCSGIACAVHPLANGMIRDMFDAMESGGMWGDMVCEIEEKIRSLETDAEKMMRKAADLKKTQEALVAYHIHKKTLINVDAKTGQLKKKLQRPCKWANHPAENGYPAGCAAHHKRCCEYLHPGEEGYDDAKAGRKTGAEALVRSAFFLGAPARKERPGTPRPGSPAKFGDSW